MRQRIIILIEDEPVHRLPTQPFCKDATCPCHTDRELFTTYINEPIAAGLITEEEAKRLFRQEVRSGKGQADPR